MHPYSSEFVSPGTCYIRYTSSAGYLGPSELTIHQYSSKDTVVDENGVIQPGFYKQQRELSSS